MKWSAKVWRESHQAELAGFVHLCVALQDLCDPSPKRLIRALSFLQWVLAAAIQFPDNPVQVHIRNEVEPCVFIHVRLAGCGEHVVHSFQLFVLVDKLAKLRRSLTLQGQAFQSVEE